MTGRAFSLCPEFRRLPALLLRVRDRPRCDSSNDGAHFGLYCDSTKVKLRGRDRVNAAFSLAPYNLKSKARRGPATLRGRDQCGAMASSCGFASRKTTRPFFM